MLQHCLLGFICSLVWYGPAALAQPNYGIDFVTIGAVGNRDTTSAEASEFASIGGVGGVNYGYKIARTELTVGQYLEFVQAYSPYYRGNPRASELTGFWIGTADGTTYGTHPDAVNFAADMTWQMAARYCNWLTNGKANNEAAFQSGAYDTSTFTQNADLSWNDQRTHSPGALFWIPTLDEWIKASYYDPNRYGMGAGGYWQQATGLNRAFISGMPEDGGETSAGLDPLDPFDTIDVGAYPNAPSIWGLLDVSGGLTEWTEFGSDDGSRLIKGSFQSLGSAYQYVDHINFWSGSPPQLGGFGLRIASVPGPSVSAGVVMAGLLLIAPRKRT